MNDSGPDASAPTPFTGAPFGLQRREVVADAAALLHGQRRLLQMLEDPGHVVRDVAHDEAVEQGDPAPGAGAGEDAAGGQELEILHRFEEALLPGGRIGFGASEFGRNPPPSVVDGLVERLAVQGLQAVLHVPDLLRDGCHLDHARPHLCERNRSSVEMVLDGRTAIDHDVHVTFR